MAFAWPSVDAGQLNTRPPIQVWSPLKVAVVGVIKRKNSKALADEIATTVVECAEEHGLESAYILAVMEVESHYNHRARGAKGERGLMQLMRGTAKDLGLDWHRAYEVRPNVQAGSRYLAAHVERYGDLKRAASRYNGGSRAYAEKVARRYHSLSIELSGL